MDNRFIYYLQLLPVTRKATTRNIMMRIIVGSLAIVLLLTKQGIALECYVCDNQEDNTDKCVKTIATCNYGEDVCLTEISWGSTPYWQQGALKQFYISKRCSTEEKCKRIRDANMETCTHIWYQDWKCSECCKGDRCNYYVISGSNSWKTGKLATLITVTFTVFLTYLQQ